MQRQAVLATSLVLFGAVLLLPIGAAPAQAQASGPDADCPATSEAENIAIVEAWYDAIDRGDIEGFDDVLAPRIIQHASDFADARSLDEVKAGFGSFLVAFPGMTHQRAQLIADGDLVAAHVVATAPHQAPFQGIEPTGRDTSWAGLAIYRIECGRIAEHWSEVSALDRLQQLGAVDALPFMQASDPAASAAVSASPAAPPAGGDCPDTSGAENAALVERWFTEVMSAGGLDGIGDILSDAFVDHHAMAWVPNAADDHGAAVAAWRTAFPDLTVEADFLMTDGDRVVARWTGRGTHEGAWNGIEASGNAVAWTGNTIVRIACGRFAEAWSESDALAFFLQIGAVQWPRR